MKGNLVMKSLSKCLFLLLMKIISLNFQKILRGTFTCYKNLNFEFSAPPPLFLSDLGPNTMYYQEDRIRRRISSDMTKLYIDFGQRK